MIKLATPIAGLALLLGLSACAVQPPAGPTVVAMPAPGMPFSTFQQDDQTCRYYASQRTGNGGPAYAAGQSSTNTAIGGTLLGTAAGALLGAAGGNAGVGAAIGAGSGLLLGSAAGGGNAQNAADSLQAQYNVAYAQCMVGHGAQMQGPPPPYYGGGYYGPPPSPYAPGY
ncbi:MAG TPA: glycine zipper family protein [Acetobacteraceae bacterium]|nr:glycine zipper family protein [Acetobacteraceae bacterium]